MKRTEIEINLNRDRAWLLETFAAIPEADLNREITRSRHDPEASWSAKDHLSHLIGIELAFNSIIKRHIEGHPSPIGIATAPDGTRRSQEEMMTIVHAMNEKWVNEHNLCMGLGSAGGAQELTDDKSESGLAFRRCWIPVRN